MKKTRHGSGENYQNLFISLNYTHEKSALHSDNIEYIQIYKKMKMGRKMKIKQYRQLLSHLIILDPFNMTKCQITDHI